MTDSYPFFIYGEQFENKRVLVTGGTKGLGEAIARRFQLSGALVATTALSARPRPDCTSLCTGGPRDCFRRILGGRSYSAGVARARRSCQ
jgi:NAD(P)-dependent dehydrogenase (short-subunit alcohol dehydrogenase family)